MSKTKTFVKGAVLGGLAAGAIGALNSPKKRAELKKRVKKAVRSLSEKGENLQQEIKPFFESVGQATKNTFAEAKRGFKKVQFEGKKTVKKISKEVKAKKSSKNKK